MEKKYVVISLFNGVGCIFIALEKVGIQVSQKISSEIDKWAIRGNNSLYPETIQAGDVRKINVIKDKSGRPIKLETEKGTIDLLDDEIILAGGSPCTQFSFAGTMKGMVTKDEIEVVTLEHYLKLKAEGFEFEGQSYLFWEYMRIKTELNPKIFLLENVIMVQKWKNVLSRAIGVNPIRIDSSLVSAQTRDRFYWCNIYNEPRGFFGDMECMIPQPKDKGIFLKDILEKDVDEKYFLKGTQLEWWDKNKEFQLKKQYSSLDSDKAITQTARQYASWNGNFVSELFTDPQCVAMRGRNPDNPNDRTAGAPTEQRLEPRTDGKTNCLTTVTKDNLVRVKENYIEWDGNGFDQDNRAYFEDGKSGTLDTKGARTKVLLNEPAERQEWTIEKKNTWLYEHVCTDCRKKYIGTLSDKCPKCKKLTHTRTYEIDQKTFKRIKGNKIKAVIQLNPSTESGGKQPFQQNRVYDPEGMSPALCAHKSDLIIKVGDYRQDEGFRWRENGKSGTLMARAREDGSGQPIAQINSRIRRLTPRESGRLQTCPEDKLDILSKSGISDSQLYKIWGNAWNIDTIVHILSYIK